MGHRQPRQQGIALAAATLLALLSACGSSTVKPTPTPEGGNAVADAGPDVEALQVQAIADALNEFAPAVHTCWARAAARDFHVEGQLVLVVEISQGGNSQVEVIEDEVKSPVLSNCMSTLWSSFRWPAIFEGGDKIQLPPFEFVAPDAQYMVSSDHVATLSPFAGKPRAAVLLDETNTGNKHASLVRLQFDDTAKVAMHSHTSAQLFLVLAGSGVVRGIGKPQSVSAGSAVYIPANALHAFEQEGSGGTVDLLQFFTPAGPEGMFVSEAKGGATTWHSGKLPKRGPKPMVRSVADVSPLSILGGKGDVRILFDEAITKDKAAYLGALTAQPGAVVPLHRHSDSSEYIFVIEGAAEMSVAGRVIPVSAGDAVQIPPGVEHGVKFTGVGSFKALQLYTPAGPEQRFKAANR